MDRRPVNSMKLSPVATLLGSIPNRLQLAGGWIDQPFVSQHNLKPPGSMVVVQIEPDFRPVDRCGIASGTRAVAMKIWKGRLPNRPARRIVAMYSGCGARLKPDIYVVNEDGDKGGKREYCQTMGMEYLVLKRARAGMPQRSSTDLRGF